MQRDTAQRRAIRRALVEAGRPLGALEVLESSKRHAPRLGIATVYRTLKSLCAEGEVAVVELPGEPPRYEAAGKGHHHHFLCDRCGKVYELGGCLGGLKDLLPRGFKMTTHELLLHGRCAACR
jgi:Fur family ferric uptake transcriptional regulator